MDNRNLVMPNGATISSWLGTAATAAQSAAMRLNGARDGIGGVYDMNLALDYLRQSISECEDIIVRLSEDDAA